MTERRGPNPHIVNKPSVSSIIVLTHQILPLSEVVRPRVPDTKLFFCSTPWLMTEMARELPLHSASREEPRFPTYHDVMHHRR
jgi:hypothetical protein